MGIASRDGNVRVVNDAGKLMVVTPKAKARGGKYSLDHASNGWGRRERDGLRDALRIFTVVEIINVYAASHVIICVSPA